MSTRRWALMGSAVLALALMLGGCSGEGGQRRSDAEGGTPSASGAPTPMTPQEHPSPPSTVDVDVDDNDAMSAGEGAPDVASPPSIEVVVGADAVVVQRTDGSARKTAAFAAPAQVLALLTSELGSPYSIAHDTQCGYDIARWDRLFGAPLEVWAQFDQHPGGPPTIVYVNATTAAGVRIESSAGFAVGEDVAAFIASLPADRVSASLGTIIWEQGDVPSQGGLAHAGGGRVAGMVSPAALDGSLQAACWSL